MPRPYKCPHCGGTKSHWKGYRQVTNGKVRLRMCTQCHKKFTTRAKIED